MIKYFDTREKNSYLEFGKTLFRTIEKQKTMEQPLVIICIGTDRATGDSLGPLVGYKLINSCLKNHNIYGTLNEPIHAKNLDYTVNQIYKDFDNPFIIVIDASLGYSKHIGFVTLSNSPLQPGKGVNKELMSIGNISITGIVNTATLSSTMLLQSTRLNTVMNLADYIFMGIQFGILLSCKNK